MTEAEKIPEALAHEKGAVNERSFPVLFRRIAGSVRITIIEGGHQGDIQCIYKWLPKQMKGQNVA